MSVCGDIKEIERKEPQLIAKASFASGQDITIPEGATLVRRKKTDVLFYVGEKPKTSKTNGWYGIPDGAVAVSSDYRPTSGQHGALKYKLK